MASVACIAVLALLAQANAISIGCCDSTPVCLSGSQAVSLSAPSVSVVPSYSSSLQGRIPSFDLSGSGAAQSSERVDRNVYQVSLDNTGPNSVNRLPVVRSQKQAPAIQKPTITLPARIPGPRTVSNQCRCVKTIVKPQVYEQLITVPVVQRYIQSTYRPVVEKIHYQAVPANANDNVDVAVSSGSGSGSSSSSSSSSYSQVADFTPVQSSSSSYSQVAEFTPVQSSSSYSQVAEFTPVQSSCDFTPVQSSCDFTPVQSSCQVVAVEAPRFEAQSFVPVEATCGDCQAESQNCEQVSVPVAIPSCY